MPRSGRSPREGPPAAASWPRYPESARSSWTGTVRPCWRCARQADNPAAQRSRGLVRPGGVSNALDRVLDLLDLEPIEVNIFRGRSPEGERRQRVFGGQVAGQALVAAGRTVPADRFVHSLHGYFIRPGDPAVPLVYLVDRVRDGRSFTTRRVSCVQHGETIFALSASFHLAEPGIEHADQMPDVPPPEDVVPTAERMRDLFGPEAAGFFAGSPIDIRHIGPLTFEAAGDPALRSSRSQVWLRADGRLPDDPLVHV